MANENVHKICPKCGKELAWRPYFHRWVCYNKECDYISDWELVDEEIDKDSYGLNEALKDCEIFENVKSNDVILWKYPYNENISLEFLNSVYENISNTFPTNIVIGIPMGSNMEAMDVVNAIWYLEEEIKELRKKLKHE